jgi:hypothetical protein
MKINYKSTALWFLDDPDKMEFDIPEPHIPMTEAEKLVFGHSFRDAFKPAIGMFKDKIQYVSDPFMEAYMKNRHKLSKVFDKEEIEASGTLIWKHGSFTFTTFYYIKTEGQGDAWAANWMFAQFSKHTDNDFQSLDVMITEYGDSTKEFMWEGHHKEGASRLYYLSFLVSFICFLKYVELETKVVNSGKKDYHAGEKYLNETRHNIEILDSTWFTTIVRSEAFKVGGHLRLQPCGPGLTHKKLIWISDFEKQGYTRKAKIAHESK